MGLKVRRLHPDLFDIDFITGEEITPSRLASNHLNFNLAYDLVNAHLSGDKAHFGTVQRAFQNKSSRLWPEWELQDWIYDKSKYLKSLVKAGIPTIDTIFVQDGLKPARVLRQVRAKGWDKFFIKPAKLGSFSQGVWHGKTQDCLDDPSILETFLREGGNGFTDFLVQPYMLKPNGDVFDEVRYFFIDGQYAYAVYTDGTDDDKVYMQPEGPMLEQTKALAAQAYQLLLSKAIWRGESFVPPITRVDVGVMPEAGGKGRRRVFINEIEMEACTLLGRYCPFNLVNRLGDVYLGKIRELILGLMARGEHVPNAAKVRELLAVLGRRLSSAAPCGPPESPAKSRRRGHAKAECTALETPAKSRKKAPSVAPAAQTKGARAGA